MADDETRLKQKVEEAARWRRLKEKVNLRLKSKKVIMEIRLKVEYEGDGYGIRSAI